ncbi:hypothetical protein OAU25_02575 [Crocinitomicaceae bacterium]|nr:hypothetical protein [Crocinitomicaceae bacterium]MDC3253115.1 hypothetical protein [Crocinitomicaceae bacterium]
MRYINILLLFGVISGCKPEPITCPVVNTTITNGALVLCEGLFQQNNSSISWIDFSTNDVDNSYFVTATNRQLGDTGNDIQRYGGKIYVVVNASSVVEVLSSDNFTSLAQIDMVENGIAKQPRSIAFSGSKAYVSCYDGFVDVIDTVTLQVTNRIQVGSNPEGLTVVDNYLYVANSGGLSFPNLDSTVSVIDLFSETEMMKLTVGLNPGAVVSDSQGDVYVISRGDYGQVPSRMIRINTSSLQVEETFSFDAIGIAPMDASFLIYDNSSIGIFDPNTEQMTQVNNFDLSNVTTLYGVSYNPFDGFVYVSDAMNYTNTGYLRSYTMAGEYQSSFSVGLNPSKVVFYD